MSELRHVPAPPGVAPGNGYSHVVSGRGRLVAVAGQVAPFLVAGLVLAAVNAPALNLLALGEDVARGLGQNLAVATESRTQGRPPTGPGPDQPGPCWS